MFSRTIRDCGIPGFPKIGVAFGVPTISVILGFIRSVPLFMETSYRAIVYYSIKLEMSRE